MPLTPLEIQKQQFRSVFRGYDRQDVDNFLQLLSKEYEELFSAKITLESKVEEIDAANTQLKGKESIIEKTLLTAEKAAQERITNAEREANIILREAELEGERLKEQALHKVRQLTQEIQELKQQKLIFAQKLKSLIDAHSKLLEYEDELISEDKPLTLETPVEEELEPEEVQCSDDADEEESELN